MGITWDQSRTLAKSCFKARKTSRFLKDFNSAISLGRYSTFSRHSITSPKLPFLGSLRLATSNPGLPELRVKMGLQMKAFLDYSSPTSLEVPMCSGFFLCCPFPVWASLAGGSTISPSSTTSEPLPPWPHFLFFSVASTRGVCAAARVGRQGDTATA